MADFSDDAAPLIPLTEDAATLDFPPRDTPGGIVMNKPPRCCYKKRMGNSYLCCEKKNSKGVPQVVCYCGASWLCGFLTSLALYLPVLAVGVLALPQIHWAFSIGFAAIFCLALANCIKLSCCDPGIFPLYSAAQGGSWFEYKPGIWLPPRSKKGKWDWNDIKTYAGWAPKKWKCVRIRSSVTNSLGRVKYRCGCCLRRVKDTDLKIHMSSDSGFLTIQTDHFCCWTGTVIAGRNMFNFRMMVFLTLVLLLYTMFIGIYALDRTSNPKFLGFFHNKKF